MKIIKPLRISILTRSYEIGNRFHLGFAGMLFLPIDTPRALLPEVELWKFAAAELGKDAAIDAGMPKSRGEFLVTGRAYPAGGKPAVACAPRVRFGLLDKTLRAVGDRFWKGSTPTSPVPFTEMPITWANAFGAPNYEQNPLGKGAVPMQSPRGEVHPLPNIEDPKRLVKSPRDKPMPAGFGPYEVTWPQRFKKAGTYDRKWLKERFPGFAADIDWTLFNLSPEDQQAKGPFQGDEPFRLEFLHPSRPLIEGRLPGAVVRCFINQKAQGGEAFRELPTQLDTVWFFPHAERMVLVYHGSAQVAEDDASDVLQLVAACDEARSPRPPEHFRQVLAQRMDKEKGALASLRERDLLPAWPGLDAGLGAPPPQEPDPLATNLRKRAAKMVEEQRSKIVALGLDPDAIGLNPLPPEEPTPVNLEDVPEEMERQLAEVERKAEEAKQEHRKKVEELRQYLADQGLDPSVVPDADEQPPGGPPSFSARGEIDRMRQMAETLRQAGVSTAVLDEALADPTLEPRLLEAEQHVRDAYRISAHCLPAARRRDAEASKALREELRAAAASGASLAGRDLTGADLTGIELPGADLSGALLENAVLAGADLSGANLNRAVLARADLTGARLGGAKLGEASLGAARLCEADLCGADLEEAILAQADLSRARLAGARLARADLAEAVMTGADLSRASGRGLLFMKSDLSSAQVTETDLADSIFLEVSVEGAQMAGAQLSGAVFLKARGNGAVFRGGNLANLRFVDGCSFERADFRDAVLDSANLRGSRLSEADFRGARLVGADLSECDLRRARFQGAVARDSLWVKADLAEAVLAGTDLMNALLQKANLTGVDLRGANLFAADMARVKADDRLQLAGANTKKLRIDPGRNR